MDKGPIVWTDHSGIRYKCSASWTYCAGTELQFDIAITRDDGIEPVQTRHTCANLTKEAAREMIVALNAFVAGERLV